MPHIPYHARRFAGAFTAVNGHHDLNVNWAFLIWSAISVGRANFPDVLRHGQFSLFELVYRVGLVYANVYEDEAGHLRRSSAYKALDPSEKSAVSYFLGLVIAKAFAENVLHAPWMMHLAVYQNLLSPTFTSSSRPDLVGQTTSGDWIVLESKGRSNRFDAKALATARTQARALGLVSGQAVSMQVGIVTHFSDGRLHFTVSDPPSRRQELSVSRERFLGDYYRPFVAWLGQDAHPLTIAGRSYRTRLIDSVDVRIGLASDLSALQLPSTRVNSLGREPVEQGAIYAGRDGLLVELGPLWSVENMRVEPSVRRVPIL